MLQKTTDNINKITHVWIEIDGKIEIEPSPNHSIHHSDVWGDEVWENPIRGYFSENEYLVTCHSCSGISKETLNKIERKFDKLGLVALKFHGVIKELCHA